MHPSLLSVIRGKLSCQLLWCPSDFAGLLSAGTIDQAGMDAACQVARGPQAAPGPQPPLNWKKVYSGAKLLAVCGAVLVIACDSMCKQHLGLVGS